MTEDIVRSPADPAATEQFVLTGAEDQALQEAGFGSGQIAAVEVHIASVLADIAAAMQIVCASTASPEEQQAAAQEQLAGFTSGLSTATGVSPALEGLTPKQWDVIGAITTTHATETIASPPDLGSAYEEVSREDRFDPSDYVALNNPQPLPPEPAAFAPGEPTPGGEDPLDGGRLDPDLAQPPGLEDSLDGTAPGPTLDPGLFDPTAPGPTLDPNLLDPSAPGPTVDPALLDPAAPGPTIDPNVLDPSAPGPTMDPNLLEQVIVEPSGVAEPNSVPDPYLTDPGLMEDPATADQDFNEGF